MFRRYEITPYICWIYVFFGRPSKKECMRKKKNIDCIVGDAGSAMTKTKQTVELMAKKI